MTKPIRRPGSAMYYARRVIPKDLRETFGRTEIWRSLDTRDLETAKPRERLQQAAWDEQFREARARPPVTQAARPSAPFSDWSIDPYVAAEEDAAWEREMEEYDARTEADPVLWAERQARIAAAEERSNFQVHLSVLREQKEKAAAKATDFQTLVDAWATHKTRQAKSIDRMGAVVRRFQKETGVSAVEAVTSDHVHTFRKALLDSTSRANGNTILRNFNTLLRFAVMEARLIANNPAAGISIAVERDPENDVHSFDLPALKRVFGSPVYISDQRPEAGSGEAAYWLPLLALYSGARLNELGQLRVIDVIQMPYVDDEDEERTVWVIRITADRSDGLRLKNAWSARRLPVHDELIRMGFLRYVDDVRAAGGYKLFPELRPDKYGTVTANWSKWFGRWLRHECAVTDSRIVFHSFRHAFKDYARESDIAEEVSDAITGHKNGSVARRYGSPLAFPLKPMVNAMKRYRVTGFTPPAPPPAYRAKLASQSGIQAVE